MKKQYIQFYKILIVALIFCVGGRANAASTLVTSTADSGTGSLRTAIANANSGDTIYFDAAINGNPILFSSQITINKGLTIIGNDSTNTIISGNDTTKMFTVSDTVRFEGIRFQNGYYPNNNFITGAAIGVSQTGVIYVESCDFKDNVASYGAAIHCYFGGDAYINNSRFYRNEATGISTNGGGAIAVTLGTGSELQISNSIFEQNRYFQNDANGRAGAALFAFGGSVDLSNCNFIDNHTQSQGNQNALGGAIHFRGFSSFSVESIIEDCSFTNNGVNSFRPNNQAVGGAIYARDRVTLSILRSNFSQNTTVADSGLARGGAVYVDIDSIYIEDSYFQSNSVQVMNGAHSAQGGAVFYNTARTTLNRSTFEDNWANSADQSAGGGAVHTFGVDTFRVNNSTFFNNRATGGTGSFGGAISDNSTRSYYVNNTVVNNHCDSTPNVNNSIGGGIGLFRSFSDRNMYNNIVAHNTTASGGFDVYWGTPGLVNIDQNIVLNNAPHIVPFTFTTDPMLDTALRMNGGLVPTLAIKDTSSIAYNTANVVFAPQFDQRGATRVGQADIGAYEFGGCVSTFESIALGVCETSYTSPSGRLFTANGLYQDTISNVGGCDSIISIDLTFLNSTTSTVNPTVCDQFISPSGKLFTLSGNYTDTISNAVGCDSIISINLTVNNSSNVTIFPITCDSYTSPSGMMYTMSGNYLDTISNTSGCDSIININLTINNTWRDTVIITACDAYTWMVNGTTYTTTEIYSDTTVASTGCDSISFLDLTINSVKIDSIIVDSTVLCNGGSNGGVSVVVGSTFIFLENFDSFPVDNVSFAPGAEPNPFPNGWNNVQTDIATQDWYGRSIGTGSSNTGPSADHTSGTGNYVFVEDGFGNNTDVSLETPPIDLSGHTTATFSYWAHSRNNSAGENEMHLDVFYNGAWVLNVDSFGVLSTTDIWMERNIDISAYTGGLVTFRFRVDNSITSFPHDIAIDDVSITVPVTNSYLWSNGDTTNSLTGLTAGSYTVTVTNSDGCTAVDSVVLAAPALLTSSVSNTACDSYTWAQNGRTYTMSGTFSDTILSAIGCDSILNLNLTILNSTTASISPVVCNSYTSPSGIAYTMSGMFTDTIPNAVGCDSVININLTVNNSTTSSISPVVCNNYTSPSGVTYTMSGMFMDTIPNTAGCDSVISINLTVNNSTISSISPVACNSYTSPSGLTYTMSGMFMDTIPNTAGCDSIISINLSIDTVNNGITQNGLTLTADDATASYQWLDCNNGNTPIMGETNQSFTASANGSYAVEVTQGSCVDTSACINVISVGLNERAIENTNIQVYPNPNKGIFTIETDQIQLNTTPMLIYDLSGSLIKEFSITQTQQRVDVSDLANGVYFIRFNEQTKKIVISH